MSLFCVVCQDDVQDQEKVILLPCLHRYQNACLRQYYRPHRIHPCPVCRKSFKLNDLIPYNHQGPHPVPPPPPGPQTPAQNRRREQTSSAFHAVKAGEVVVDQTFYTCNTVVCGDEVSKCWDRATMRERIMYACMEAGEPASRFFKSHGNQVLWTGYLILNSNSTSSLCV